MIRLPPRSTRSYPLFPYPTLFQSTLSSPYVLPASRPNPGVHFIKALLTSTAVVALAEVGDKTQLPAIVLATRFKRPWPIIGGIFAATIANHFLAALLGAAVSSFLAGRSFRYLVPVLFPPMADCTLLPDN